MVKLTEKQKRFIDYYVETGNATEAARLSGYKGNNLDRVGHENLRKLEVYIQEKMATKDAERVASQNEVLEYLSSVLRGEATEKIAVGTGNGYQELMDKEVGIKDRLKAAELLGKREQFNTFMDNYLAARNADTTVSDWAKTAWATLA